MLKKILFGNMGNSILAAIPIFFFFFSSTLLLLSAPTLSYPLCSDSTAPFTLNTTLKFCPDYDGSVCCNSSNDSLYQKQFEAMNISDTSCASLIKSILCARCDQFSAELYTVDSAPRPVPILCNSTVSDTSPQSKVSSRDFCSQVWDTCQNISMLNSPFSPSLQGRTGISVISNSTKLTELYQSKTDFCTHFGGASTNQSVCFNGQPVSLNQTETPIPAPDGMCIEKIGNGSYINMVPHPDGSGRAFFNNQEGYIFLASIPKQGTGESLTIDESSPFVDLTDQVRFDTVFGMLGLAFHPNFAQNGRFYASFNCDKVKSPGCSGRCLCNSDVNCDPSKIPVDSGIQPCQIQNVVAEYTVNGTGSSPSLTTTGKSTEVRRIITMGLPWTSHHGGQILFGPDGYLYFMMGDGSQGDPYNFAQNKKSLLGKILRVDVDHIPSSDEIDKLGLWGNYTIPEDNPYREDQELLPEIYALGFSSPWRCSFDSERPSYFMCGDVGGNHYEEIDIVTKGGNYGWRIYEGPLLYTPTTAPGGSTPANSINPIFPVMGYNHSSVNNNIGSAAITGGYFYRSDTDQCMKGKYLFGDLYATSYFAGTENPENSGNFTTTMIPFNCANDSPLPCSFNPGNSVPALGYLFSFSEDNNKDIYLLTSSGVYRIVDPRRCNYTCSKETGTIAGGTLGPTSSPGGSYAVKLGSSWNNLLLLVSSLLIMFFSSC